MKYLKLFRYQNLIFIALAQVFIKYGLFLPFNIDITLSSFEFALLVIATLCIAAGGNVINDIYDVQIDKVNKPDKVIIGKLITESSANRLFVVLNVIGVGIGFYLSNVIERPSFAALFIVFSAMLYLYASYLKGILLVGNIVVSFLVAMSLIIVGLFDLLPAITPQNQAEQSLVFEVILRYALFAFSLNLIREIVKDIQDINGDKKGGINTLPIAIGRKRTLMVVFALTVFLIVGILAQMYDYLYNQKALMLYFLLGIIAPLLFFCVKTWSAEHKKDFKLLSNILKIVMLIGTCSLLLFQFVIL